MRQTSDDRADPVDPYAEIAEYYDLEHDSFADDLGLIRHMVETVGDPVLELGCGSGRVLAALAFLDMRLTGIDTSEAMLDRCRRRLAGKAHDITMIQADMTSLPLDSNTFGIVVIALNGLLHATTMHLQREVLAETQRVLDPRGLLYLDIPNPVSYSSDHVQNHLIHEGSWRQLDGGEVSKRSTRTVDFASQLIQTRLEYDRVDSEGRVSRRSTEFPLRYLHLSELELMLELVGFAEWQVYGSYELDPFTDSSPRLIVTAEKTASA